MVARNVPDVAQHIVVRSLREALAVEPDMKDLTVFLAVPNGAKVPYLKLGNIVNQLQPLYDDKSFAGEFDVFIFAAGKNSGYITGVLHYLKSVFPEKCIGRSLDGVSVVNVVPVNFGVTEDLELGCWKGFLKMSIVATA